MNASWTYRLKRAFGNRYAITAVLFLLITLWGSATVAFGLLEQSSGCKGYARPKDALLAKADPAVPGRSLGCDPTDLAAPAPVTPWPRQIAEKTAAAEAAVTKAMKDDHTLIEVFGAYQNFAGRTVVEDAAQSAYSVVKLADGSLSFVGQGEPDAQVQAGELKRLQTALDERDIGFLYLQAPSKLKEEEEDELPYGVWDSSNACADRLLAALEEQDVDSLDLRGILARAGGERADWFYKTDHHWTQEAAFLSFQALARELERYTQTVRVGLGTKRQSIAIEARYTDPDSYDKTTLSRFFLGSQGKRVGTLYTGVDDFVLWTPKFPTLLHYAGATGGERYGDVEETVLFPQRVEERDLYNANPYTYYAGGDYPFARVTNYYNPQGPKVMLIRDSFACAMTPYLALSCSQLTTIDPRSFTGDLLSYIDWLEPDVVVVLYSTGLVREEEPYRLLAQGAGPSKADALRWKTDQPTAQK